MKILAKTIIEVLGSPKEHVEETMQMLVEKAKHSKNFEVTRHEIFPAKKVEQKPFWTTFTEMEIETDHVIKLMGFCFDFMPSSVEILDPQKLEVSSIDIGDWLNDLLAKLHQYDMVLKNIHAENILLKRKAEKEN